VAEPTWGFRGSEYSQGKIEQFLDGHTGDRNPVMGRPTEQQVNAALAKGTPVKLEGHNAEQFDILGAGAYRRRIENRIRAGNTTLP